MGNSKYKILTVVGARPQFIKAAAISRTVKDKYADSICEDILHTGQHYDDNMSGRFFAELNIPQPRYNLGVGSGPHGRQTARMLEGIEEVLTSEHYDGVLIYGDTNSTLAGALAASKLHVPVFHVEAGLRSRNMAMPEEVNRVVADRVSSLLFAPTEAACANLQAEGFSDEIIVNSGDVMFDNALYFSDVAEISTDIMERLGLKDSEYVLATVHRDFNTDSPDRLNAILGALEQLEASGLKVVLPLHPRTRGRLGSDQHRLGTVIEPVSYLEMLRLERHAAVVLTDSGGVQKEAYFFGRPCVILRPETEWVEIVECGAGELADADEERIVSACRKMYEKAVLKPDIYGDGHAAEKILKKIYFFIQYNYKIRVI